MSAERVPYAGATRIRRALPCFVVTGPGTGGASISVQLPEGDRPRRAAVVITCPRGSLGALLSADEVAAVRDELDRAEAELLGLDGSLRP